MGLLLSMEIKAVALFASLLIPSCMSVINFLLYRLKKIKYSNFVSPMFGQLLFKYQEILYNSQNLVYYFSL